MPETYYPVVGAPAPALAKRDAAGRSDAILDLGATRRFLSRRWRIVAGVTILCAVLASLALALAPRTYTAMAIVITDPRTQKVTPADSVLDGIGSDAAAVESQVEILESSTLAKRVIARLELDRAGELTQPSLIDEAIGAIRALLGSPVPEPSPEERQQRVLSKFEERLHVRRRGLTYVLEIAYASGSAKTAAQVANAVAEAYLADQQDQKFEAARSAAGMLSGRLDALRGRARDAERAVSTYKTQNDIVDVGSSLTLLDREITEQSQQLAQAKAGTVENETRYEQAKRALAAGADGGATLAVSLQSTVIANLRNQYAQLGTQLADLRNNLGPRHPAVATAEAQVRLVADQIQKEIARLVRGLRNESEASAARERTLTESIARLKQQAARYGQARVRLAELEREAQASKVILEQYLLRQKETSEQQNLKSAEARILTPAAPPLRPSSPKTGLLLGLALAGGLVLGLGAAAAAEAMAPGMRTASAVELGLGVPLIGVLPRVRTSRFGRKRVRLIGDGREHPGYSEAIRMLALPLRVSVDAPTGDTLLVTSALDGEGKSTVAEHLAETFARQGLKVLLVDLDTRSRRLTRTRHASDSPGLLDALREAADPGGYVHSGMFDSVSFLPIGLAGDDGMIAELLLGPALDRAMADLRRRFDLIVLDGPHLLQGVEGRLLLAQADRTALVVEWGRTARDRVQAALSLIEHAPGRLAGIVFNKVDGKAFRRYA